MKILGFEIGRKTEKKSLTSVGAGSGFFRIFEANSGNWQRNVEVDQKAVLAHHAVFACMTLIASDISKLRVKLVALSEHGIWTETTSAAYSPVLRKPNKTQTRIQFWECWLLSKLSRGNTYVLKQRDNRGVVTALWVLDPDRCKPLIAPDGSVFYEIQADNVAGIEAALIVPANELIHDRYNCLFHPLVGISPLYANGLAATQGLSIQNSSTNLFNNGAKPGGLLIAPERIEQDDADRLKAYWDSNFTGDNAGKIAVIGGGMQFQQLTMSSADAQLIEQLRWSAEVVCSTFHVPPYKIGVGEMPKYDNIQALNVEYYSQGLQNLIEAAELLLDEGLATGEKLGTEFDVDNLLRMDSVSMMDVLDKGRNIMTPNEGRKKLDLPPKPGGDAVYRQQQDYSIEALSKRDAKDDPFAKEPAKPDVVPNPANDDEIEAQAQRALETMEKGLA